MISAHPTQMFSQGSFPVGCEKYRRAVEGKEPDIFTDIYQEEINIAIWQRELSTKLKEHVNDIIKLRPTLQIAMTVSPQSVISSLNKNLGVTQSELSENIAELVDMYCCLFELKGVGLRLTVLDRAMCPKFHVDKVPCRLVSTYYGVASEWLPHHMLDRSKLGSGSKGLADHQSGLYRNPQDIQQLSLGDVALLKGESWEGNENAGLVHRSPAPSGGENRLLLTLDSIH